MRAGGKLLGAALIILAGCTHAPGFQSEGVAQGPAPWSAAPKPAADVLRFAVVGDNTGLAKPGVFDQAMTQLSWMRPDFVIAIGDLIEGYTEDKTELNREWDAIDASVRKAGAPFFFVPGNHDMGGDASLAVWKARKGAPYYAFTWRGALFLCLDSEDPPLAMPAKMEDQFHAIVGLMQKDPIGMQEKLHAQLAQANARRAAVAAGAKAENSFESGPLNESRFSDAQVEFVRRTLAEHQSERWTFVLMHKPGWKVDSGNFAKIEQMLADRPYTMIAGHYHYYSHEIRNGRDYIMMGTTGAVAHQDGPGHMDHIAWVTLDQGVPDIANIRLNGLLDRTGQSGQRLAE